ncbi:MAG: RdgB/HAM1 family non-canonical purine NTP pyrophosphatase, partial [Bacteroidales bacterium]
MNTNFIFATNNPNKLKEVRHIANNKFNIVGIDEFGITEELPETQNTLEGNALQKARYLYEKISKNCFADDTGLEVEALNGRPGIFSARYAGEEKSSIDNIKKLLNELKDCSNRSAQFRTVVALILNGKEYLFEGIIKGKIIGELKGENGFGYDPVFVPLGFEKTFAELPLNIKNTISHRAQ